MRTQFSTNKYPVRILDAHFKVIKRSGLLRTLSDYAKSVKHLGASIYAEDEQDPRRLTFFYPDGASSHVVFASALDLRRATFSPDLFKRSTTRTTTHDLS